jgi:hypothetical protein
MRANEFKKYGPTNDVGGHFAKRRSRVAITESQPALREQYRGQRARDEQEVIEPIVKECDVAMGLD